MFDGININFNTFTLVSGAALRDHARGRGQHLRGEAELPQRDPDRHAGLVRPRGQLQVGAVGGRGLPPAAGRHSLAVLLPGQLALDSIASPSGAAAAVLLLTAAADSLTAEMMDIGAPGCFVNCSDFGT